MKLKELQELIYMESGKKLTYKQMEYGFESKVEVLFEGAYKGYQFYILNLGTHPTAYIEIPRTNKLFGKDYDDIDIGVHGGLTYADDHLQDIKKDTWFIGLDYAHFGDYFGFDSLFRVMNENNKKWTTEEIFDDVVNAIEQIIEGEYE